MTESDLLMALLQTLTPYGVCILHGYKDFPSHISSDIDALVTPQALQKINTAGANKQISLVQHLQHESTAHYYVFSAWDGLKPVFIRLDVSTDFRVDGRVFFSSEDFFQRSVEFKPYIKVPPADLEFGYYLIKKVIKASLESSHTQQLSQLWQQNPEGCRQQIERFFGPQSAQRLVDAAQSGDWSLIEAQLDTLRKELMHNTARTNPRSVAQYWIADIRRRIRRVLNPTGLVVAILGSDGSGKSTVIDRIQQDIAPVFRRLQRYHLRPGVKAGRTSSVPNPHDVTPRNPWMSVLKLIFWWVEYWLGFMFKVWPQAIQSTLVIFDRYYFDLLVDPLRYRFSEPKGFARLVAKLIPQPQLVIFLDAPAEVIHSRKQELGLEELERQRQAYRALVQAMPNGYIVDASRPSDQVAHNVEKILLDFMANKTANRLGQ